MKRMQNQAKSVSKRTLREKMTYVKKNWQLYNVIKLRNDGFEGNTKNVLLFFYGKFEFFC